MKFPEKLIELRKSRGWSQEQLGEQLGVTRQTISKWELGSTTPELEKLAKISELFGVSTDELIMGEAPSESLRKTKPPMPRLNFEYKSRRTVHGIPLLHINFGIGRHTAKGIFAVGNKAVGVVACGFLSLGVVSVGLLSLGLMALGTLAAGGLAFGAGAAGVIAFGGAAAGWLAFGGAACGMYAIGGASAASDIAFGGSAAARVAIGDIVRGTVTINRPTPADEVRSLIMQELPSTPQLIADMFSGMAEMLEQ